VAGEIAREMCNVPTKKSGSVKRPLHVKRYALIITAAWTMVVVASFIWSFYCERNANLELARAEARGSFNKDLVYRRWNANHGGIYVPVTENTPPNPNLSHLEERDIATPSGQRLTLMNPAYMTRQVYELGVGQYGQRGHITSLNPIRASNAPDAWEEKALKAFAQGATEVTSIESIESEPYLRLMRPMVTEKSCLKCHAAQGYKEGDLRGGISVSVPMNPYLAAERAHMIAVALGHGLSWIAGIGAIGLGALSLQRRVRERDRTEEALRESSLLNEKIISESPIGISIYDEHGQCVAANDSIGRMVGATRKQVLEQNYNTIESWQQSGLLDTAKKAIREGTTQRHVLQVRSTFGKELGVECFFMPFAKEGTTNLLFMATDIAARLQAEDALRESEERFRAVFETAADAIFMADAESGIIISVNASAARLVGLPPEEIIGRHQSELHPKDEVDTYRKIFRDHADAGGGMRTELCVMRADGSRVPVEISASVAKVHGRNTLFGIFRDITERKHAEEALREKTTMLDNILRSARDVAIATTDLDFRITYYNPMAEKFFGYTAADVVGKTVMEMHTKEKVALERFEEAIQVVQRDGCYNYSITQDTEDGPRHLDSYVEGVFNPDGELVGFSLFSRDVTERKEAEEALRQSEARYQELFDSVMEGIGLVDQDEVVRFCNPAFAKIFEADSAEELLGRNLISLLPEEQRDNLLAQTELRKKHVSSQYELDITTTKNNRKTILVSVSPRFDESGNYVGALGTYLDITKRKRAEEDLLKQKVLLSRIIESTDDAVFIKDLDGRYLLANSADARQIGIPLAQVLGAVDHDLFPAEIAAEIRRADRQVAESGEPLAYEQTFRRPGRKTLVYQINKYPQRDLDGTVTGVIGIARDITQRKEAEQALRESEEKLRNIVEHSTNLFYSHTADHVITYLSPQVRDFLDCEPEEAKTRWTEFATDHPVNQRGFKVTQKAIESGQRQPPYELELVGKKGRKIWVEVHEVPLVREGKTVAIVGALTDITKRKRAEEARQGLEAQLRQSQKMEAVAQLAGGVAHDFNNLLTVINGYVSLAKSALPDDHKAVASLSGVQEAAEQAAGVTRSLLTFSCKTVAEKMPVELQTSVEKSLRLLRHALPASIKVVAETADAAVWVHADDTQLQQVIMNLAINARDAMPDGGTLRIGVSQSSPEAGGFASPGGPRAPIARLIVSDSGTGMEPDVCERIFEPFFTTKPRGQSTGLGLAIIHGIVEDHDGRISVESEPGRGTTFAVELPVLDSREVDALRIETADPNTLSHGQGELVLLAEDNRQVLGILTSALESLNYKVVQASDGFALLDCFEHHRQRIELLVIDVDLPKRNGLDCLRDIRSSDGFAPAIVITASTDANLKEQLDSNTTLLHKPFNISDFTTLADAVLASRRQHEK